MAVEINLVSIYRLKSKYDIRKNKIQELEKRSFTW